MQYHTGLCDYMKCSHDPVSHEGTQKKKSEEHKVNVMSKTRNLDEPELLQQEEPEQAK